MTECQPLFELPGLGWFIDHGTLCVWATQLTTARQAILELTKLGYTWTHWGDEVGVGASRLSYWKPKTSLDQQVSLVYVHVDGPPRWTIEVENDGQWELYPIEPIADNLACDIRARPIAAEWGPGRVRIVPTLFWSD